MRPSAGIFTLLAACVSAERPAGMGGSYAGAHAATAPPSPYTVYEGTPTRGELCGWDGHDTGWMADLPVHECEAPDGAEVVTLVDPVAAIKADDEASNWNGLGLYVAGLDFDHEDNVCGVDRHHVWDAPGDDVAGFEFEVWFPSSHPWTRQGTYEETDFSVYTGDPGLDFYISWRQDGQPEGSSRTSEVDEENFFHVGACFSVIRPWRMAGGFTVRVLWEDYKERFPELMYVPFDVTCEWVPEAEGWCMGSGGEASTFETVWVDGTW